MPYVDEESRQYLDPWLDELPKGLSEGEVNYIFTRIINSSETEQGRSYAFYNATIGILECCKLELYRRLIAPYEDGKCRLNGDVFTYDGT
jgi:uncharacterized protein DUF6899